MALPKLTATDEMKQIAASDLPRKEKIAYGYVQEVCEYYVYLRCITQDGILKVAFFFPEHLRIDGNSPAYEVYLDKEKRQFITYNTHQCSLLADPAGRCCSAAPALLSKKNQMVGWCGGSGRSGDLLDRYFLL